LRGLLPTHLAPPPHWCRFCIFFSVVNSLVCVLDVFAYAAALDKRTNTRIHAPLPPYLSPRLHLPRTTTHNSAPVCHYTCYRYYPTPFTHAPLRSSRRTNGFNTTTTTLLLEHRLVWRTDATPAGTRFPVFTTLLPYLPAARTALPRYPHTTYPYAPPPPAPHSCASLPHHAHHHLPDSRVLPHHAFFTRVRYARTLLLLHTTYARTAHLLQLLGCLPVTRHCRRRCVRLRSPRNRRGHTLLQHGRRGRIGRWLTVYRTVRFCTDSITLRAAPPVLPQRAGGNCATHAQPTPLPSLQTAQATAFGTCRLRTRFAALVLHTARVSWMASDPWIAGQWRFTVPGFVNMVLL